MDAVPVRLRVNDTGFFDVAIDMQNSLLFALVFAFFTRFKEIVSENTMWRTCRWVRT